ncbi:MAG: DUF4038 domain-containing protein [Planctomycetes bacterium]|nr:DUF4038 domain-containing protein [Planctomycetota bacterium]
MTTTIRLACLLLSALPALAAGDVPLWGRWELALEAAGDVSSETQVTVKLTSYSGRALEADGFWDGGRAWKVRFRPDEEGEWRYETRSSPAAKGLDGVAGAFRAARASSPASPFLRHGAIRVAKSGTHLEHSDGTPFLWIGDTVWNGPLLSAKADWETYLEDRASKAFTGVQFNVLAPWRTAAADGDGQVAFTGREKVAIHPRFFQRLDERMEAIERRGLLAAPALVWSLTAKDPGSYLPEEDAVRLARYQVARYGAHHVLWILAGDNPYDGPRAERWKRIGRACFADRPHAPVTTHPTGMNWPWEAWRGEAWLDVLGYQSGHGDGAKTLEWIHSGPPARSWANPPVKPAINLEPPYEAHVAYQSRKPHGAHSVRRAIYWSLLATPVAGFTYGGHGLWSWQTQEGAEPEDHKGTGVAPTWRQALDHPGSTHVKHAAGLLRSIEWWRLRPAQEVLAAQPGKDDTARFVGAARSAARDLALLYLPAGGEVALQPGALAAGLVAEWFDPREGRFSPAKAEGDKGGRYEAPGAEDWVLVLRKG